uniref:Integrase core domain containing protein n=1 Tax=Solanum tuberosum TaxID=4113 RepID=M1DV33_SOLTU
MPPPGCTYSTSKEFFEQSQHQKILQFHMGLNDNYSQARSQILLMPQLPIINQAYDMVNLDESQRMVAGSTRMMPDMVPTAMFTSKSGPSSHKPRRPYNPNAFCDFCNIKGHTRTECNKLLKCDFCHKTGHLKVNCFRLIGYPADYKGKREVVIAGNSTYDTGPIPQHYQSDKPESTQPPYAQMQSLYHT